jgi:hypothetical protein
MPATDPASLLAQAACYECFGNLDLLKIVLLSKILNAVNPNVATDPASLLASANCYLCFGNNANQLRLMELALLSLLVQNGVTLGDSITYAGPPKVNPPSIQNIVVDSNGRQWQYFGGGWN